MAYIRRLMKGTNIRSMIFIRTFVESTYSPILIHPLAISLTTFHLTKYYEFSFNESTRCSLT